MHRRRGAGVCAVRGCGAADGVGRCRRRPRRSARAPSTGDVVDQAGAAVPGATVTVTAVGTNLSRTVVTRRGRRLLGARPGAGAVSGRSRAERFRPLTREGVRAGHRRNGPARPAARGRRRGRSRHRHRRCAAASQRDVGARPGRSTTGRSSTCRSTAAASSRWRRLAPGVALPPGSLAAAHQRRAAAHQRVPVRRHLGAAARARPGRVLSERRRDPGVQDRNQQPAGRVRPLQRRRREPDDEVGRQRACAAASSSSSGTRRSTPGTSSPRRPGQAASSAATSSAASRAARSERTGRSSSPTTRASGRRSAAR